MKFLKRLFIFLLLIGLGAVGLGYYHGLRPDNVDKFITDLLDRFKSPSDTTDTTEIPEPTQKTNPSSKTKTKETASIELQPLPPNPFEKIDRHARKCPNSAEKNVKALADYFAQVAHTDIEKARAIYTWLTDNIKYDDDAYNFGNYGDHSAEGVLTSRRAVCEGFSNLYLAIGQEMGLEIEKVSGYAKGYSYTSGKKFTDTDHAWNLIKINGQWRLFDATWGQGNGKNVNGKLVSKKEFDNYWFNVDPYEGIFNHMPQNRNLTHVTPNMDLRAYEVFPNIDEEYFELGFDGKETYQNVYAKKTLKFPKCYNIGTHVKATAAPKHGVLYLDKSYDFEFYIPRGLSVAIIDAQYDWTYFDGQKGVFKLRYIPTVEGELQVSVKYDKGGKSYKTVMIYNVKGAKIISQKTIKTVPNKG